MIRGTMRIGLLMLVLAIFSSFSFGQKKLFGKFCSKPDLAGRCINFINDSSFEYYNWTDLGSYHGAGIYKIVNANLILNFKSDDTVHSQFTVKDEECNNHDSILLTFSVSSNWDEPAFAFISLSDSLEKLPRQFLTDYDWKAVIKIKRSDEAVNLKIYSVESGWNTIKLIPDNCKKVSIKLYSIDRRTIVNGTIWKFKIIRRSDSALILEKDGYSLELKKKSK